MARYNGGMQLITQMDSIAVDGNTLGEITAFFASFLVALVVGRLLQVLCRPLEKRCSERGHESAAAVFRAGARPLPFLLLIGGIAVGRRFLVMTPALAGIVDSGIGVLTVALVAWLLYRLVDVIDSWLTRGVASTDTRLDDMLAPMVRKSLRVTIVALALVQTAQMLSNQPVTSILAGLGVGGLAVALAAQETVKNFFGSLVILADKPFELTERIVVDGHDGTVEAVGFRSTRIRTLEGHLVTVPNGELANKTIQNIGKRPNIRYRSDITITYDTAPDKIEEALRIIRTLLDGHAGMRPELPPRVNFSALNSDSLNIQVLFWFHPADYWAYLAFCERFHIDLMRQFNDAGIEFAFPTQTLYLKRP